MSVGPKPVDLESGIGWNIASTPADVALAHRMLAKIMEIYPNHAWMCHADHAQGITYVKNLHLSHEFPQYASLVYQLPVLDLASDPTLHKSMMRAGGTLLEYFNMPRRAGRSVDYAEAKPDQPKLAGAG